MTLVRAAALVLLTGCGAEAAQAADAAQHAPVALRGVLGDMADAATAAVSKTPHERQRAHCERAGGAWVDRLQIHPCHGDTMVVSVDGSEFEQACDGGTGYAVQVACAHYLEDGGLIFNDGPSVPHVLQALGNQLGDDADIGPWNDIFWDSAVNHDYCYHHNPITYGLSQEDCDRQLFSDLSAICREPGYEKLEFFSPDRCRTRAAIFFASVRGAGRAAFDVMNTRVAYPEWKPLWQQFGMEGDASDAELAERIESYVGSGATPATP